MFIILVSGFSCSGKDTVAEMFCGCGFKRYAVADNVKRQSAEYHGFDYTLTLTQEGKATYVKSVKTTETKSVRTFLIEDSLQNKLINKDSAFWIRLLVKQIQRDNHQYLVISDWRYKAEYEHLKFVFPEAEFLCIRVERDSVIPNNDASEHELDSFPFDHILKNNSTKEVLKQACYKLLNNF